jgi:hypothetical protein
MQPHPGEGVPDARLPPVGGGHGGGVAEARVPPAHVGVGELEALVHARVVRAGHPSGLGRQAVVVAELAPVGDQGARHVHGDQPQLRQQRRRRHGCW